MCYGLLGQSHKTDVWTTFMCYGLLGHSHKTDVWTTFMFYWLLGQSHKTDVWTTFMFYWLLGQSHRTVSLKHDFVESSEPKANSGLDRSIVPSAWPPGQIRLHHGLDFSGYSRISGFRFLSKSIKNGVEMHFECDFVPFRIQMLTQFHPCYNNMVLSQGLLYRIV